MRRKKHIVADLKEMHTRYTDVLNVNQELEAKVTRLEKRLDEEWAANHRCHRELRFAEAQIKDFDKYLTGEGVSGEFIPYEQRWAFEYLTTPESLALRSSDRVELTWDQMAHAFRFYFSVVGSQQSLVATIDRVIWTMKHIRRKATQEPDQNGLL